MQEYQLGSDYRVQLFLLFKEMLPTAKKNTGKGSGDRQVYHSADESDELVAEYSGCGVQGQVANSDIL